MMIGQNWFRLHGEIALRLETAQDRREQIIFDIMEDDDACLLRHECLDPVALEDLSIEVDALQTEIDRCEFELRALAWRQGNRTRRHAAAGAVGAVGRLLRVLGHSAIRTRAGI